MGTLHIAGLELANVGVDLRRLLATEISFDHATGDATVSKMVTTVLTANTSRAITLPAADPDGAPAGTTFVIIKVDAAGSGKVVLTPASGDAIGDGAADATWSSPASAVNGIAVVSDGAGTWEIAEQGGTWT